jgi:hypothetical protein
MPRRKRAEPVEEHNAAQQPKRRTRSSASSEVVVEQVESHEVQREEEEKTLQRTQIEGNVNWVAGESDVRQRAPLILRMLAELYKLRWDQERNDRFKMIHWRKMANFIEEFENPIRTEEDVESLNQFRGFGPSSFNVVSEIQMTGYLDWIDELTEEVRLRLENRGDEQRLASLMEIQAKAESLGERNAERRAAIRQSLVLRAASNPATAKEEIRIQSAIDKAVIVSGKQRKKFIEEKIAKSDSEIPKEFVPARYQTRGVVQVERVEKALVVAIKVDSCAVCMEDYNDEDNLAVFKCEHCFHLNCIKHWLQSRFANGVRPSCPLCREPIAI